MGLRFPLPGLIYQVSHFKRVVQQNEHSNIVQLHVKKVSDCLYPEHDEMTKCMIEKVKTCDYLDIEFHTMSDGLLDENSDF